MKYYILTAFIFFMIGCSYSTHYVQTGSKTYPSTKPEDIRLFSEKPSREYLIIGSVAADVTGDAITCRNLLKLEAASVGADAVIFVRLAILSSSGGRTGLSGVAIKYAN